MHTLLVHLLHYAALPQPLAELYSSGIEAESARLSAACTRSEDMHICSSTPHKRDSFCDVPARRAADPHMQNCGGTRPTGLPFAGRSPVYAQHGMAATSVPLSTMCAIDMLKAGGTAVDGAIAANACEGVVEPMMNGLGGDLMAQVWHGPTRKLHGYNGSGRSPKNTSYTTMQELLREQELERIPGAGPLGVSVPGAVQGWWDLHQRFGRLPWPDLFAPAIGYAEKGHPVAQVIAAEWYVPPNTSELTSGGRYPHALDNFLATFTLADASGKRRVPRAGEIFTNPRLARSLRAVAAGGAREFYNGSVAREIVESALDNGLLLTLDDFATHHGEWVAPVNISYRGKHRIFELPPNPQGIAALQMLNLLERYDLGAMGFNSADYLHLQLEAKKLAFADRAKFYADPDFGGPDAELVSALLSKEYAATRAQLINMSVAAQTVPPGMPASAAADATFPGGFPRTAARQALDETSADTMYLTVADAEGTMVSLIQSNYEGFGSGLVAGGFGLQDRGSLFNMAPGSANQYQPGKRPFHTIIPGFATVEDAQGREQPWLSFGVMGGNIQPQGHAQIIANLVDFGMNVQEAGDAARYTHSGSSQPTGQVMHDGGSVQLEGGVCAAVEAELRRRGHHTFRGPNAGGYQAIMYDHEHDSYIGATEMRKDGIAAGF